MCAFKREKAALHSDAAGGRKAADFATGRQYAVARHDDRERVRRQRLPHGACRRARAKPGGDIAVRQRCARRDGAYGFLDATVKRRCRGHVEGDGREIAHLAVKKRDDGPDHALHVGLRRGSARRRKPLQQAGPRLALACLRELHTYDSAAAPRNATATSIGKTVADGCHGAIIARYRRHRWRIAGCAALSTLQLLQPLVMRASHRCGAPSVRRPARSMAWRRLAGADEGSKRERRSLKAIPKCPQTGWAGPGNTRCASNYVNAER
jgi:hypothetical protein